jgi:alcohol dehydrogenase class IV
MRFEFATAARIIFGRGTLQYTAPLVAEMGKKALVVTGRNRERSGALIDQLEGMKVRTFLSSVPGEPTVETIRESLTQAKSAGSDVVIGVGGGSVVDAGKAVAALLTNGGDLMDYLEVIGEGRAISRPPAPYVAIPTTAGTGAEVTKNAVIESTAHGVKVSMRSPLMFPRVAIVDPELTLPLTKRLTAFTGLDALTQLIEAFVSRKATPLTDGICREGLKRATSIKKAWENGTDVASREDMSAASLFSGLALANGGLGAVHGFAGPFGGMYHAPHGAVCAALLPHVMEVNIRTLKKTASDSGILARYDEVALILTGDAQAEADDGVDWVKRLCEDMDIPSLSEFGLTVQAFPQLVQKARNASSMKGNPVSLSERELATILERAL